MQATSLPSIHYAGKTAMLQRITSPLLFLAIALAPSPLHAERLPHPNNAPYGLQSCPLEGWTNDALGEDIPLRAISGANAAIIGSIPYTPSSPPSGRSDPLSSLMLTVDAAQSGWLHVAAIADDEDEPYRRTIPATSGWIPADSIRFGIQSSFGYFAAKTSSPKLVDLKGDWATEVGKISNVWGCSGDWVLIDYRQTLRRADKDQLIPIPEQEQTTIRAWFRGTCGNQLTTCDMPSVDQDTPN